jgi:glycosyltransferase involved in cell wall biosynthesis
VKKVLVIARIFPPFHPVGFSIRVVKFIKYLPVLGWSPSVLTVDDRHEYEFDRRQGSATMLSEVPGEVLIHRTAAGEPSLEFLKKGRAFGEQNWLTRLIIEVLGKIRRRVFHSIFAPDHCVAWLPFALSRGCDVVRSEKIDVILTTCPPYSATVIGACLKVLTRKPLILDFRDDWIGTTEYYAKSPIRRMIERRMERWTVKVADKVVLVTEASKDGFLVRYPKETGNKFVVIPNGCDLEDFAELKSIMVSCNHSKFTIVHAGSLIDSGPWTRSAGALFRAVRGLLQQEPELAERLSLVFAGDFPERHRLLADEMGLSGVIEEVGHLPHEEVLRVMKSADLLVAIATEGRPTAIPGKIYEYWAVGGPPILLLSGAGAAASLVEQHGLGITVDHDDVAGIQEAILTVYRKSKSPTPLRVNSAGIEAHDRKALTRQLAHLLSTVSDSQSGPVDPGYKARTQARRENRSIRP